MEANEKVKVEWILKDITETLILISNMENGTLFWHTNYFFFFYAVKLNQDMPALLFSKYWKSKSK